MSEAGRECAQFGKFNLVGLIGAALQLVLLHLLVTSFHLPEVAAAPIAVETVVLHNFVCHERFTWRDQDRVGIRQRSGRLWRFHLSNGLISIAGNTVLISVLVERFNAPAVASAAAAIALCAPVNFLVADLWVYRQRTATSSQPSAAGERISSPALFTRSLARSWAKWMRRA
jgi:putative flippase GtrA